MAHGPAGHLLLPLHVPAGAAPPAEATILFGTSEIAAIEYGTTTVTKVYSGTTQVWPP